MKSAIITGITGQDGRLLSVFLREKGYHIVGLVPEDRNPFSIKEFPELRSVKIERVDYFNTGEIRSLIDKYRPQEFYNLASLSSVRESFNDPIKTLRINCHFTTLLLEILRGFPSVKFYQASSSEMFGNQIVQPMTEESIFRPESPYAVSKVLAHNAATLYRQTYGMHISCGILFNHESRLRSPRFVSRKITQGVVKISLGHSDKLLMGSLTPVRDWGAAKDYVEAMWLMLQQDSPDDYIVATGEPRSVLDFVNAAFKAAGISIDPATLISIDRSLVRRVEIDTIWGDASKAKEKLGWQPKISFEELVADMIEHDFGIEES
jgi:GDPmannose 4,6-dehydratase